MIIFFQLIGLIVKELNATVESIVTHEDDGQFFKDGLNNGVFDMFGAVWSKSAQRAAEFDFSEEIFPVCFLSLELFT